MRNFCPYLLSGAVLAVGCAGSPITAGDPACSHLGYREGQVDHVVCPGAERCECQGSDRCCVLRDERLAITGARCGPPAECTGLPLRCDGPEDCADGERCCFAPNGSVGSRCVAADECRAPDEVLLCRRDAECAGTCTPAESGTYFDGAAAFCAGAR